MGEGAVKSRVFFKSVNEIILNWLYKKKIEKKNKKITLFFIF